MSIFSLYSHEFPIKLINDENHFICLLYQSIGYAMPRHRVIDIDTPEDWDYACAMAKAVEELKLD